MNLEHLVNIYNTLRQITVSGDNVKLMYTCLTEFEEVFSEIQKMQETKAATPVEE